MNGPCFDLVLKNGTVVDGTGTPGFAADVGVAGDRIVALGEGLVGRETLDCAAHVVAPGFVDCHSHSDLRVLADPTLEMKLHQGITLEVLGQDGLSAAPVRPEDRAALKQSLSGLDGDFGVCWDWSSVGEYLARLRSCRPAQDLAYLAPHGAIRQLVVGGADRKAGTGQLQAMAAALGEALREGACGMSTGLIYPPCCYADTEELIALGQVLAAAGKPFVVHLRSESDRVLDAVAEVLLVAESAGCAVHISHIKIAGRHNQDRLDAMLRLIEDAQARGLSVTADQYPYDAGSTLLGAILPPWTHDGGLEATLLRLADASARARMRAQMADAGDADWDNFWKWTGPEGIVVADIPSGRHPEWLGKSLLEIARARGQDPFDAAFDLLRDERLGVAMISFSQAERVVDAFMARPWVSVCTDGLLGGRPHPRAYGSYPRVLGRFVRERRALSLEQAVRKMTAQAASAYSLADAGRIAPGLRANLVVFDPATVADRASYEDPLQLSVGVRDVVVGGALAVREGRVTGERAGTVVN